MSCIRFNTKAQRAQQKEWAKAAPSVLLDPLPFSSPTMTASKLNRLCLLATDDNPKIRERVALDYNAPEELLETLSHDLDDGVRACVARNEVTPCDILRALSTDPAEIVRGFVALNFYVPADCMEVLGKDPSEMVRGLVGWKSQLV